MWVGRGVRYGMAGQGMPWQCRAGQSREGKGIAWQGMAGHGGAGNGSEWHGR